MTSLIICLLCVAVAAIAGLSIGDIHGHRKGLIAGHARGYQEGHAIGFRCGRMGLMRDLHHETTDALFALAVRTEGETGRVSPTLVRFLTSIANGEYLN